MIGSFFTRVARATRVRTPLSSSLPLHRTLSSQIDATERVRQKFAWNDKYPPRHLGVTKATDIARMLKQLRVDSIDTLIDKTVPQSIRNPDPLDMTPSRGEHELLGEFQTMMNKNQVFRTHIGCGYHDTVVPKVIVRNMLENPAWYTPYTPYQAEISQGRLQMLLNFQTMIVDLTSLPIANASLLDEGTALAEAMNMCWAGNEKRRTVLVSSDVHPQNIAVLRSRAEPFGINVRVQPHADFDITDDVSSVIVQYPATNGQVDNYGPLAARAHRRGAKVIAAADILALTVLKPPGEWGADVCVGTAQRFGVAMGFGGPHAAFFAATEVFKRKLPGRIIGVSIDCQGEPALRMAMQTREQHIRRGKATSNICTAQALLANMSAAYGIYHGPNGLRAIGEKVHALARTFAAGVEKMGLTVVNTVMFDTVHVSLNGACNAPRFHSAAQERGINLRRVDLDNIYVSFDEANTARHVTDLLEVFADEVGYNTFLDATVVGSHIDLDVNPMFKRRSPFMTHEVFNSYHSETEMMRYLMLLQSRDLGLAHSMIPLGSCTMKLNAASAMIPITWKTVADMHPFTPFPQTRGYTEMMQNLRRDLCELTGFDDISLQPNAGSQGEYTGLKCIKAYHAAQGQKQRDVCLIPTSAHGTNPASAVMAGLKVVIVQCDDDGNVDIDDLKRLAKKHRNELSCLMVTYPSTHGVFEKDITYMCEVIHAEGGQVYMDGANMNAQVGLCKPGTFGADVSHLNLHKTFAIPHGGGGPGMGPIGVMKHLSPFLPSHPLVPCGGIDGEGTHANGPVASAPFSSASILPISYMYIRMMGGEGLTRASEVAILNANYMASRLEKHYDVLYRGEHGFVAHEFIIDLRAFKKAGISEEDVCKRLIDYNCHGPTMSWPVVGTLMVEPTESESLKELDRFCDAMINIRAEIEEVLSGAAPADDNVLVNAPHSHTMCLADDWTHPYSRAKAAYPLSYLRQNKFWPSVGRLNNVHGDRNVVCTCPPLSSYGDDTAA